MDQREEYWGNPIHRDPEGYNSPQHYDMAAAHAQHHRMSHLPYPQQQHPQHHHHHQILPSPRDHITTTATGAVAQHPVHLPPQEQVQHYHHPTVYDPRHQQHLQHRNPQQHQLQTKISDIDVLCGRGKTSFNHEGNKTFRLAVSAALDDFINAVNRFEKAIVVQRVVDSVHTRGGRFLKEDTRAGTWYRLSDQQSKEKVGHAIRDAANLYEVRKKKEEQMLHSETGQQHDATPQLKRTHSDEDEKGSASWWLSQTIGHNDDNSVSQSHRSSYTPTDYSIHDYSVSSANKRRTSMESTVHKTMDYQPQRKRRRTASPSPIQRQKPHHETSYFHSTMALTDHIVSTPSPPQRTAPKQHENESFFPYTTVRRSPIIDPEPIAITNVVSSGESQKSDSGGGLSSTVMRTNVSSKLKRSPIAPINADTTLASEKPSQYYHQFTVYDPKQSSKTASSNPLHFAPSIDEDNNIFTAENPQPVEQEKQSHRKSWGSGGPSYYSSQPSLSSYSSKNDDGALQQSHYSSQYHPYPYNSRPPTSTAPQPGYFIPPYHQYPPQQQYFPTVRYGPPPPPPNIMPGAVPPAYYPHQQYQGRRVPSQYKYDTSFTTDQADWTKLDKKEHSTINVPISAAAVVPDPQDDKEEGSSC